MTFAAGSPGILAKKYLLGAAYRATSFADFQKDFEQFLGEEKARPGETVFSERYPIFKLEERYFG